LAGDWTGSGVTTIGLYDPAASTFYLKYSNGGGSADNVFTYGPAGQSPAWIPVAGNWTGSSVTTVGLFNSTTATYYLIDFNTSGYADTVFDYGAPGTSWTPIVGAWGLAGSQTRAAVAAAKLALPSSPSPSAQLAAITQSMTQAREAALADDSLATVSDAAAVLDAPATASLRQPQGNVPLMPDALYLDAVLESAMAHNGSTKAAGLGDLTGTDDGFDLLANAIAGQSPAKAIHSSLSDLAV
jgi:hypothetical protein